MGRDFLPRGAGIVTRVPLIIQLIHVDEGSATRGGGGGSAASGRRKGEYDDDGDASGVTRRRGDDGSARGEWAVFLHDPDRRYTGD